MEVKVCTVKFTVSIQKVELSGSPLIMQIKSNLIKSLIDKLDLQNPNPLASNIPLRNKKSLQIMWDYLNSTSDEFSKPFTLNPKDMVGIWPWLDYFDVPYDSKEVKDYVKHLMDDNNFNELIRPQNKSILDDVLKKIKIIDADVDNFLVHKLYDIQLEFMNGPIAVCGRFTLDKRDIKESLNKISEISLVNETYWFKMDLYNDILMKSSYPDGYKAYWYKPENDVRRHNIFGSTWKTPDNMIRAGFQQINGVVIKYHNRLWTYPVIVLGKYASYPIF